MPIAKLPEAAIAEARQVAAKHGYTLTNALVVTRVDRSLFRKPVESMFYYLRGTSASQPGVERLVWLCELKEFPRLRDLDDVSLKLIGLDSKSGPRRGPFDPRRDGPHSGPYKSKSLMLIEDTHV